MWQRSTADERSFGWWGEIVVLLHLRFAAGVCVLAAGLLMGGAGGAVAVADPGSSGSAAHGDDGTNASGQHSTDAKKPKERARRHGHRGRHPHTRAPRTPRHPITGATHAKNNAPAPRTPATRTTPDALGTGPSVTGAPHRRAPVPDAAAPDPVRSRRFLMRWRRYPIWSGQFLTSSRRFRTCSPRLPVRSSRSRNCSPTFIPSCWASPGWRRFNLSGV